MKANSIVFSTPCFQQAIHPTSTACQTVMNLLSPAWSIISTQLFLVPVITVRQESAWSLTLDIIPGRCDSHPEPLIADIVSAQTTFPGSPFTVSEHEEPQYCPCQ